MFFGVPTFPATVRTSAGRPFISHRFVRRNFNVQTRGEHRSFFLLRSSAPDAVPAGLLRNP